MSKPPASKVRLPWLALIGLLIAPALYLCSIDWSVGINNNILELLPEERDTAEGKLVRQLLNERLTYPVIVQASAPGVGRDTLVNAFIEAAQQPGLKTPYIIGLDQGSAGLREALTAHRETLFAGSWLNDRHAEFAQLGLPEEQFIPWLAQTSAERLNAFLDRPESMAYADEIPQDPLLLLPSALEKLPKLNLADDGSFIAWIPVSADPLTTDGQDTITASLAAMNAQLLAQFPSYEQVSGGVYEIARESEQRTKAEVSVLNLAMGGAILGLLLLFTRRPGFLLLTLAPVAVSVLWCFVAAILVFGHIHVIAIAVCSVVLGLAVDYAVHLAAKRGDGNLMQAWPHVRVPLAISCLSTCFGFTFLLLSPMLAMKQVGVMAPAGLLAAILAVRFLLPWMEPIAGAYRLLPALEKPGPAIRVRYWAPIAAVVWLGCLALLVSRQPFSDDIADFQTPLPDVFQRYRDLADRISHSDVNERWYAYAKTPAELAQRLQAIQENTSAKVLLPTGSNETLSNFASQSNAFAADFKTQLKDQGFDAESFAPFFASLANANQWQSPNALTATYQDISGQLEGPLQAMLMTNGDYWAAIIEAPSGEEIPDSIAAFTRELSQHKPLNAVLDHAREGILRSAAFGLLGVTVCVAVLFRRKAIRSLLVPIWAVTIGLAITWLIASSIGLLAAIGAVLAFCLALDYGAFTATSSDPPSSIRISAATTFSAFLILSFCSMPAVAQLGQVVAASVFFAWLMAELLSLPAAPKSAHAKS
ncbi:MMPL family transporter [Cerasicoccus maritimus]|uniref:MMPL family transporter n=1 Tax=Cerasicoccus maritimus TaxID=490089 RepID=UPI002852B1FB|nr:MMPL family transporter [Cerasicoccus maritimus]